ncbi:MAG: flagellar filament capping protein FliD [Arcobacter butzleri]|jgi:flagellar hook-associated protein 2|nr:flagellar filament capping protein FliD [Arcobacteraceae bacterium]MDY0364603.1 flagellar filament capping protein FliD [Arcobacteraceae bacterium]NLO17788.1 flagellar filament capping protein FliD [Aliarcobacter butzleri]
MATGILGLGSAGAAGLNQELIEKLKEAEKRARVEPFEKKLETWDKELEQFGSIEAKVDALLGAVKDLDLFKGSGNAFEQIVANTSGNSAIFEAVDPSLLRPGMLNIDISQLATRDVYQTSTFSKPSELISQDPNDKISIQVGDGSVLEFSLNQSFNDLSTKINNTKGLNANIEKVGDNDYRLIIKSTDSGEANKLTISTSGDDLLGLNIADNHVQEAQNMKAKVDGIEYNVSSNTITVQGGLNITAVEIGKSSINIEKDNTAIAPALQKFVDAYNDVVDAIDGELYNADTPMQDLSSMRMILSNIKNTLFGTYGDNNNLNIFNYGFEIDKSGKLTIDNKKLGEAVLNNLDELKDLFIGKAESKGLGTTLKELVDGMKFKDGLLSLYGDSMSKRQEELKSEKTKAIEQLDAKYLQLAQQFAAYTAIITQMESSFGGLKMMIEQSTAR